MDRFGVSLEQMRRVRFTSLPLWAVLMLAVAALSCRHPGAHQDSAPSRSNGARPGAAQRLDHVMPARDSIGSAPKTFTWTAVPGADSYSIGIWNEVDML